MNVSLTPHLEAFVAQKVNSGFYTSASEVIREALRLFEEADALKTQRLNTLRKELQAGIDSGPVTPINMEAIKEEARKSLR